MIPLTFEVPDALSDPLIYERVGAIIKERATGQIAGHIQQLGGWDLLRHVPIPGGNPLELATQAIQMAQLHKIQQTLNTVQTLATVGAVASVATLGVSVAGFAAVLSKLKRMEGKLDQMLAVTVKVRSLVERLHVKVDALPMAALQARLEAVSMARLYDKTRRRDALQDAVENLAELRHYYGALLASQQFCALGTENLLPLLDMQERLVAACEGELFAEFLLDGDPWVIAERWRHQNDVFDAIAWQTPQSLYQLAEQGDRDDGVFMVTSPEERRAKVMMLVDIRNESMARLASVPALVGFLHEQGVTTAEYIRSMEEISQTGESLVIVDARAAKKHS
jgi:hypothetical protein